MRKIKTGSHGIIGNMHFKLSQLDGAYRWLCQQRQHCPPDADIWHFRYCYPFIKHKKWGQVFPYRIIYFVSQPDLSGVGLLLGFNKTYMIWKDLTP